MIVELLVAVILLALFLLVAGFLIIPLRLSFSATLSGLSTGGEVSVRWLGIRLLRRSITGGGAPERGRRPQVNLVKMARASIGSLPTLVMLLRAFRRSISVRSVSARVTFGLGDPAETAVVAGYIWAMSSVVNLPPSISLRVQPDLEKEKLEGTIAGEVGVRLLPLAIAFARAYTRKPFRTLISEARKGGT